MHHWSLPWAVEWIPFNQPCTPLVPATPAVFSEWKGWLTAAGFSITDNVSPSRLYKKYSTARHTSFTACLLELLASLLTCDKSYLLTICSLKTEHLSDLISSAVILDINPGYYCRCVPISPQCARCNEKLSLGMSVLLLVQHFNLRVNFFQKVLSLMLCVCVCWAYTPRSSCLSKQHIESITVIIIKRSIDVSCWLDIIQLQYEIHLNKCHAICSLVPL